MEISSELEGNEGNEEIQRKKMEELEEMRAEKDWFGWVEKEEGMRESVNEKKKGMQGEKA